MTRSHGLKTLGLAVATTMLVIACGPGAGGTARPGGSPTRTGAAGSPGAGGEQYTLGFSNPLGVGNGFREEQLCTAVAQAKVSGQVSNATWIHRNTDANGQLADLRTLVAANPSAIIFNPLDPEALNPALDEAQAKDIVTVAIDAYVTDPETYNLSNDQEAYGYIGAKWLFEHLGDGDHTVWYMRGIIGHPADTDRHAGVTRALGEHPNITLYPSADGQGTNWDPTTATNLANEVVNSPDYDTVDGIWTSGMDSQVVDVMQASGKGFKPIVGADLRAFIEQLLNVSGKYEGLEGIAVYNPASVGGAGVKLALQALNGEDIDTTEGNTVFLPEPPAYDNVSDQGRAKLQEINVPELDALWPVSWQIPGWTDYDFATMKTCTGPGKA